MLLETGDELRRKNQLIFSKVKTGIAEDRQFKFKPKAIYFVIKESLAQMFSCEFCDISKNIFF